MGDGLKHSTIPIRQPLNVFFNNESTFDVHSEKINLISTGSIETSNMIVKYDNVAYEWNSNVYSSIFDQNEFSNIGNVVILKSIPYSKLLDKEDTSIDNIGKIQEPDVTSGGTIQPEVIDTDYKYLAFPHSGGSETQTPYSVNFPEDTECDILIVGGGGGGGSGRAGGAGAGACIVYINYMMNGQYIIKVGKGGAGSVLTTSESGNGIDSEITNFDGNTVYFRAKGGGGGTSIGLPREPQDGGCGGGARSQTVQNGGIAVNTNIVNTILTGPNITATYAVYGNMGGRNTTSYSGTQATMDGAGGGGIGQGGTTTGPLEPVDNQYIANNPGKGGDGLYQSTINGINYNFKNYFGVSGIQDGNTNNYYIGGGGGGGDNSTGTGGNGGKGGGGSGGNGTSTTAGNPVTGAQNTGSGGGGGAGDGSTANKNGGNGGSGIVIIRYKLTTGSIFNGKTPGILKYLPTTTNPPSNTGSWTIQEADSVTFKSDFLYTLPAQSTSTLIGNNYTTDFLFDPDTKFTPKENWGKNYTYNICASVDTKYCFVFVYFNKPTFNHKIISSNDDSDWTISDYTHPTTTKRYVKITVQTTNPIEFLNIKI